MGEGTAPVSIAGDSNHKQLLLLCQSEICLPLNTTWPLLYLGITLNTYTPFAT